MVTQSSGESQDSSALFPPLPPRHAGHLFTYELFALLTPQTNIYPSARYPPYPLHTIGAVAAVHAGNLAVHTGCPELAGGGTASNAFIVGKGLLLAVHS